MKSRRSFRHYLPRIVVIVGAVCGIVGLLCARVLVEGERELHKCDSRMAADDFSQAIVHARRSAAWYLPGAAHVPAAYTRLIRIAQLAEGRGDVPTAVAAYRSIRAASISSRFIILPHANELAFADASLARLSARRSPTMGAPAVVDTEVERIQREALARADRPRTAWVVAMCAAVVCITAGLWAVVGRNVDEKGAVVWAKARIGLVLFGAGALLWAIALWRA